MHSSARSSEVLWEGEPVGSFEFLAVDFPHLVGYWTANATPHCRSFLDQVKTGRAPRVRLAGDTPLPVSFRVDGIERGRRWRGEQAADVQVITLSPSPPPGIAGS